MNCIKCGKKTVIFLPNLNACNSCFLKIIDRRVRKEIRINELIAKNDRVLIIDDESPEAKISIFLLKEIIKDPTVKIRIKKSKFVLGKKIKGEHTRIVIPWNADREAEYFLESVLENKRSKYLGHYKIKGKSYPKILLHVLEKEAELFSKLKKISYIKNKKSKSFGYNMISRLGKEYPEIIFSLIKSSEKIKKVYK